jgi:hypothetical protein
MCSKDGMNFLNSPQPSIMFCCLMTSHSI